MRVIDCCHPLHTNKEFNIPQSKAQSYTIQDWDLDQKSERRKGFLNCKVHVWLLAKVLLKHPMCHWTSIIFQWQEILEGNSNPVWAEWMPSEGIYECSYTCQDVPWYPLPSCPIVCPDQVLIEYTIAPVSGISLCFPSMKPVHDWMYSSQRKKWAYTYSTRRSHIQVLYCRCSLFFSYWPITEYIASGFMK